MSEDDLRLWMLRFGIQKGEQTALWIKDELDRPVREKCEVLKDAYDLFNEWHKEILKVTYPLSKDDKSKKDIDDFKTFQWAEKYESRRYVIIQRVETIIKECERKNINLRNIFIKLSEGLGKYKTEIVDKKQKWIDRIPSRNEVENFLTTLKNTTDPIIENIAKGTVLLECYRTTDQRVARRISRKFKLFNIFRRLFHKSQNHTM